MLLSYASQCTADSMEQGLRSIQMIVNRPNFLDFGFGNSHGASIKTYILVAIKKKKKRQAKIKSLTEKVQLLSLTVC